MNEKNEQMISLPWTVPQQQSTQTIVLQQPAKTHMELNASTDKTAISSFALSVVVALILGGLATWLAYWYGKKSFDLTKQSFDAVIAQIKSSEKNAFESNKILHRNNNLNVIRELIGDNQFLAGNVQNQFEIALYEVRGKNYDNFFQSRNHGNFKETLSNYQSSINRLRVYLDNQSMHSVALSKHFRKIQLLSWNLYNAEMNELAMSAGLEEWIKEFKLGEELIQNYLDHESDHIYK